MGRRGLFPAGAGHGRDPHGQQRQCDALGERSESLAWLEDCFEVANLGFDCVFADLLNDPPGIAPGRNGIRYSSSSSLSSVATTASSIGNLPVRRFFKVPWVDVLTKISAFSFRRQFRRFWWRPLRPPPVPVRHQRRWRAVRILPRPCHCP